MYATPLNMLDRFDAVELAQLSDKSADQLVTADLLAATIRGEDLAAWSADEQAAAVNAVGYLTRALNDQGDVIDGFLQARYKLPLPEVPRLLVRMEADLARHDLQADQHSGQVTETVAAKYKSWMAMLGKVSTGGIQLGLSANDQPAVTTIGPRFHSSGRVFTRDSLGDY